MKNSYDSLNDTFNTDPVDETAIEIAKEEKRKNQIQKLTDDVSKDYDYTRGNLYSLPSPKKVLDSVNPKSSPGSINGVSSVSITLS